MLEIKSLDPLALAQIEAASERTSARMESLWEGEDPWSIGVRNWPGHASVPPTEFRVGHTGQELLLWFRTTEHRVLARWTRDQDPVWQDSCLEFFVRPRAPLRPGFLPEGYYNFEVNPLGTVLAAYGPDRHRRQATEAPILARVRRYSSWPKDRTDLTEGRSTRTLALVIPREAFFAHVLEDFTGLELEANAYACGDGLPEPYYGSWQAINTEAPDFHRPEFFGLLRGARHI